MAVTASTLLPRQHGRKRRFTASATFNEAFGTETVLSFRRVSLKQDDPEFALEGFRESAIMRRS
jgi:hypothetical protein